MKIKYWWRVLNIIRSKIRENNQKIYFVYFNYNISKSFLSKITFIEIWLFASITHSFIVFFFLVELFHRYLNVENKTTTLDRDVNFFEIVVRLIFAFLNRFFSNEFFFLKKIKVSRTIFENITINLTLNLIKIDVLSRERILLFVQK